MAFKKKIFSIVTASIISVLSIIPNVYVQAAEADSSIAYIEFDGDTGLYTFRDSEGNDFDSTFYEKTSISLGDDEAAESTTEAAVTTSPTDTQTETTQTAVTTTSCITGTFIVTKTITKTLSPAETVADYTGRYRDDGLNDWDAYLQSYTTTTTTTTTTKAVYNGIDVSRHQGNINWAKVKAAGVEFAIIRAGYGMEYDQVDAKFHANIQAAQKVGIECGVYWYSYALNTSQALKEAQVCYDTIKNYKLTYPVAFDIEDPSQSHLSKTEISNITKTFCDYIKSKGYYVSVYSYASLLKTNMNDSVLDNYDIWVAHTGVAKPNYSKPYAMWQYSWTGSVDGINTDVDLDYCYKNYPDIIKKGNYSGN